MKGKRLMDKDIYTGVYAIDRKDGKRLINPHCKDYPEIRQREEQEERAKHTESVNVYGHILTNPIYCEIYPYSAIIVDGQAYVSNEFNLPLKSHS